MGNPTSYLGKTLTWEGKQLEQVDKIIGDQLIRYSFAYDENGLRTQKTIFQSDTGNTETVNYYYNGSVLIGMTIGADVVMRFSYDASGNVVAVDYSTDSGSTFVTYYYVRNAQNDIVKLIDGSGNTVVEYTYDSWGKVVAATSSLTNGLKDNQPFRYRSYVYDAETQWYYLQSRYYDPTTCRFISADVLLSTGQGVLGHNSFAYCLNNPLNRSDSEGNWSGWATLGLIVGAALCIAAVTVLTCGVGTATLAGAVAVGAAQGALIGAAAGTAIGAGVGYATTGTAEGALTGAAIGFGAGALVGAVIGGSVGANSWYSAKALEFTNNPGSSEVVLGRTGTYEKVATERSSTFFHTSEARWSEVENMTGVGRKGMWKINRAFLKQQISAGKSFVLANNPSTSGGILFQKEVKYLIKKGISYVILGE